MDDTAGVWRSEEVCLASPGAAYSRLMAWELAGGFPVLSFRSHGSGVMAAPCPSIRLSPASQGSNSDAQALIMAGTLTQWASLLLFFVCLGMGFLLLLFYFVLFYQCLYNPDL